MKIKSRLYCPDVELVDNHYFTLVDKQAHYVRHVMRANDTDYFGIFNGKDGEYVCQITENTKKNLVFKIIKKIRNHLPPTDITLVFALIKKTPLEFLVQKATELGVGMLQPIITDRTIIRDTNIERLESIAIEAAEQCGLTAIPKIFAPKSLNESIKGYQNILFCDERGQGQAIKNMMHNTKKIDAIIIGPEGGFSPQEADFLYNQKNTLAVSLGKRIMRAETAAIASLSIIQAIQDF
jgi:16S rRNA (uracil1498-N3)-methyltransferase